MFWNKIKSSEYLKLAKRIDMMEIDVALLQDKLMKAVKQKALKKEKPEETSEEAFNDGLNDLRNFNKP